MFSVGEMHDVVVIVDVLLTNLESDRRRRRAAVRWRTGRDDGCAEQRSPMSSADTPRYRTYLSSECWPADAVEKEVNGVIGDADRLGDLLPGADPRIFCRSLFTGPPASLAAKDQVENHVRQLQTHGSDADGYQHDGELALRRFVRVLRLRHLLRDCGTASSSRLSTWHPSTYFSYDTSIVKYLNTQRI